jgi:hypothetical protein
MIIVLDTNTVISGLFWIGRIPIISANELLAQFKLAECDCEVIDAQPGHLALAGEHSF